MTLATDGRAPAPAPGTGPTGEQQPTPTGGDGHRDGIGAGVDERQHGRFPGLDGLRALAAFAVLVTHAGDAAPAVVPRAAWNLLGVSLPIGRAIYQLNLGVEVFFVVSAFLVYRPFLASHVLRRDHPEPVRFLWKRACRIFPAYWVALFVIVGVSAMKTLPNAETVLTHTFLVYGYDPLRWYGGNIGLRHSWTLVVEIAFYAFVPLWAWILRGVARLRAPSDPSAAGRRALRIETVGAALLVPVGPATIWWTAHGHSVPTPLRVLPAYLAAFGAGMLLAAWSVAAELRATPGRMTSFATRLGGWWWVAAAVVFAAFVKIVHIDPLGIMTARQLAAERLTHAVVATLIVLPAVIGAGNGGRLRRFLHWRPLALVGLVSYGFYLWHYFVLDTLQHHVFTDAGWGGFVAMVAITAVAATAIGALSWRWIERPFIDLAAGKLRRPTWLRVGRPSFRTGLGMITLGALVWRVAYVVGNIGRLRLAGDAFYYHTQANDIAHGRWFIDPSQYAFYGRITPSAGHPPNYILYLAGVSKWIGTSELTHRLASTLLGAATVWFVGILARMLFDDDRVGWFAAFGAAVYAHLWINDEMLMSEGMAQLWTVIMLIAVYKFWKAPSTKRAAWMGAAVSMAALSRAEAATLFPLLVIPLVFLLRDQPWRQRIRMATVSCVIGGLVLLPWVGYNLGRFAHPVVMSNGIGSVLMVANCDATYSEPYLGYWSVGCASGFPTLQKGDESEKEVEWRRAGLDYITSHKTRVPEMVVYRVARMWDIGFIGQNAHPFNSALEGRGGWQSTLATMQYLVFAPLAVHGLVLLRRRRVPILPFLALAGTITITAAMTFGITRYRAPVDAILPVLAAGALFARLDRSRARPSARDAHEAPVRRPALRVRSVLATPTGAFLVIGLLVGTTATIITPAFTGYDEPVHFLRTWDLSSGHLVARPAHDANGDRTMVGAFPKTLISDIGTLLTDGYYAGGGPGCGPTKDAHDATCTFHHVRDPAPRGPTVDKDFPSTAVYTPVPYLPATIAVGAARVMGLSTLATLWAARFASLCAYLLLVALALRRLPRHRWLFAALALAPVCTFQAAMVSADGMTIALVFLAVALAVRAAGRSELVRRDIVEIGAVVLALGLAKPPFVLTALLFVPALIRHRHTAPGRRAALACLPGVAAFAAWSAYAQSVYVTPRNPYVGAIPSLGFAYHDVDTARQTSLILHHPLWFLDVIWGTIRTHWQEFAHDMLAQTPGTVTGSHGTRAVIVTVVTLVGLAIAATAVEAGRDDASDAARAIEPRSRLLRGTFAATAVVLLVASFALAYTGWNAYNAWRIDAFQGRYLFPSFLIAVFAVLPRRRLRPPFNAAWVGPVAVTIVGGAALANVVALATSYA